MSKPTRVGRSGETEATTAKYVSGRLRLEAPSGLSDAEIRLLPTMPLHAITTVHGEAGLEQRLLIEIADLSRADRFRIERACTLMSVAHACDRRRREPYANHYADLRVMPTWRRELLVTAV